MFLELHILSLKVDNLDQLFLTLFNKGNEIILIFFTLIFINADLYFCNKGNGNIIITHPKLPSSVPYFIPLNLTPNEF